MDAAITIAGNVVNLKYKDLSEDAVTVTKKSILDTLGVMIAASTQEPACKKVAALAQEGGGKEESTIIAFGGKVPCLMAAFANGSLSHALDYDDTHDDSRMHASAQTLPAALATADKVGKVNGKEFIVAVALGIDLCCRLGLALNDRAETYWLAQTVFGCFSSAAASGRLLGLTQEQMVSAFGIALYQASGSRQAAFETKSVLRGIRDAFAAKAGVLSALMAQRDLNGGDNSLEGRAGLFNLYFAGHYDRNALTEKLGKRFEGVNISFKPWPSFRLSHIYMEAVLDIVKEHKITASDVVEMTAILSPTAERIAWSAGELVKPEISIQAKRSIPFTMALALVKGKVSIGDFLPENLKDPEVLRVAAKINYKYDPSLGGVGVTPGAVRLKTKTGKVYTKRVDHALGHPENPMSSADLVAKFEDCARYSAKPLTKAKVKKIVEMVQNLEKVEDVSQLTQLLS